MRKVFPYETRHEFLERVCAGESLQAAARWCGVSSRTGRDWWAASGLMEPRISMGRAGGLPGTAPALDPGGGRDPVGVDGGGSAWR